MQLEMRVAAEHKSVNASISKQFSGFKINRNLYLIGREKLVTGENLNSAV